MKIAAAIQPQNADSGERLVKVHSPLPTLRRSEVSGAAAVRSIG